MSYTIPEYVDTQEQAILAVASAVKGEQVTGGDGGVNTALDILADTLAGENVQVPMTQQGAILAIAQYVDGMVKPEGTITITENGEGIDVAQYATADVSVSGGGVDVGAPTFVGGAGEAPTVGEEMFTFPIIALAKIGDVAIYDGSPYGASASGGLAAGLTLTTNVVSAELVDTLSAYVCTADDNSQYATVAPWGGTLTRENAEYEGDPAYRWTFTMPELQEGERLVLYPHMAD